MTSSMELSRNCRTMGSYCTSCLAMDGVIRKGLRKVSTALAVSSNGTSLYTLVTGSTDVSFPLPCLGFAVVPPETAIVFADGPVCSPMSTSFVIVGLDGKLETDVCPGCIVSSLPFWLV